MLLSSANQTLPHCAVLTKGFRDCERNSKPCLGYSLGSEHEKEYGRCLEEVNVPTLESSA